MKEIATTSLLKRAAEKLEREYQGGKNRAYQRRLALQVADRASIEPGLKPVVFFNCSTRLGGLSLNAGFSLVTSLALRLSGFPVVHFVCERGMSRCVLGTQPDEPQKAPPCRTCITQSDAIYAGSNCRKFHFEPDDPFQQTISGLNLQELSQVEADGLPLGEIVLPSLRWILRRHHLEDDETTRYFYGQYLLSARLVASEFNTLLEEVKPGTVILFNGQFFPEAVARRVALSRGIRTVTHEVALLPFTCFFTDGEATAYPIDIPDGFQLTPEQDAKLDAYLKKRFEGNFSMAGVQFWPEMRNLGDDFWQKASQFRQVVPVYTNVVFDTSQGHANKLYKHMFEWLDDVLKLIQTHPETYFVIRAHPDELRPGKASRESVAEWVSIYRVAELPNVLFVDSDEYFSSYELIQRSKFVMVYNSTIGLEASLMGVPVLCAGKARFTQIPTVFFPESRELFMKLAETFFIREKVEPLPVHQQNARRFLYYQLFCTALPFNDYLEKDPNWQGYVQLKTFPLEKLLPQNSGTMDVIINGIRNNHPLLMEP